MKQFYKKELHFQNLVAETKCINWRNIKLTKCKLPKCSNWPILRTQQRLGGLLKSHPAGIGDSSGIVHNCLGRLLGPQTRLLDFRGPEPDWERKIQQIKAFWIWNFAFWIEAHLKWRLRPTCSQFIFQKSPRFVDWRTKHFQLIDN